MMPDREKVIKSVETCFDSWIDKHRNNGYDMQTVEQMKHEALKLLKEQPEIVRCGECAHGHLVGSGFCVCDKYGNAHYHDWYCADGERR